MTNFAVFDNSIIESTSLLLWIKVYHFLIIVASLAQRNVLTLTHWIHLDSTKTRGKEVVVASFKFNQIDQIASFVKEYDLRCYGYLTNVCYSFWMREYSSKLLEAEVNGEIGDDCLGLYLMWSWFHTFLFENHYISVDIKSYLTYHNWLKYLKTITKKIITN